MTAVLWGGADVFYKLSSGADERASSLKITFAVGMVMGLHALVYWLWERPDFAFIDIVRYLPVSSLYILSMVLGYIGFRYLRLSIASPVGNASGAVAAILCIVFFTKVISPVQIAGILLVTAGVVLIAVFERRAEQPVVVETKYQKSFLAILLPIAYCLLDGAGTFADAIYLDELSLISEDAALIAYELTFFLVGVCIFVYLFFVKKDRAFVFKKPKKYIAALLETAGQYFYVFAMSGEAVIAAPLVASYSLFSVVFSALFLKERLSKKQYIAVAAVLVGIAVLGLAEELG